MTLVGAVMDWWRDRRPRNPNNGYDPEMETAYKERRHTLLGAEGGRKPLRGFEKYFGDTADLPRLDHPSTGTAMRRAVASVNAYWGIYGVYRENFFQADNDRLARNAIFALIEKAFMDYLGIVEWEVINHEEKRVDSAETFLKRPNPQDTFPTLLKTAARDIIRYDAGAWVKTMSTPDSSDRQYLLELKAYAGPEFWIEIDRDWTGILGEDGLTFTGPYSSGYVKRYWQHAKAGIFIPFDPSEVVYFMCYPRSDTVYGTDFMTCLKWYLEYLQDSTKAAGMTFANGVMPGMKYRHPQYTSVSQLIEANKELEAASLGPENFNGVVNLIGEEDIEPLTPTMVDMQWLEGQTWVAKLIWAMFGFSSSEFIGDDTNRATAYVARNITKSRMLSPILRKFEEMINTNVLPDLPGYESGWKFQFKDVLDLDDELKQTQIEQARATVVQTYMQMGVPVETAMIIAGVEDEKVELVKRAIEEAQAMEPSWDQGIEGGGGPMGPPGPGGGLNTNPQAGQALSPQEAAQYYADTPGDMGPQMYHREDYQGAASSQDHEGSDEDQDRIQKAGGPASDEGEEEDHPVHGKVRKVKVSHPDHEITYVQDKAPPKGTTLYRGPRGGVYYLRKDVVRTPEPVKYIDLDKEAKEAHKAKATYVDEGGRPRPGWEEPGSSKVLPKRPHASREGAQGAADYKRDYVPPKEDHRTPSRSGAQGAAAIAKAERVYLKPGEAPPDGYRVYEGEKGGRFYLAQSRSSQDREDPGKQPGDPQGPEPPGGSDDSVQQVSPQGAGEPGSDQEVGETQTPYSEEEVRQVLQKYAKQEIGKGVEVEIDTETELGILLDHSKYALISAGANDDEKKQDLGDEFFRKRHDQLKAELTRGGYVFTQVLGRYGAFEDSFLVMAHDADRDHIVDLGAKMNQSSVIFVDHGKSELITTRGDRAGEAVTGEGYSWVAPDCEDNFTAVYLKGRAATVNFALNFDWDTVHEEDVATPREGSQGEEHQLDPAVLDRISKSLYEDGHDRADKSYSKMKRPITRNKGKFAGLEFRLKSPESIRKSLEREHRRHPTLKEDELVPFVDDIVRFTSILEPENYLANMVKTLQGLEATGVKVLRVKNAWRTGGGCYRGVNVKLQVHGQPVELQFHTPETWDLKQNKSHPLYEKLRTTEKPEARHIVADEIRQIFRSCSYPPGMETWHYAPKS